MIASEVVYPASKDILTESGYRSAASEDVMLKLGDA